MTPSYPQTTAPVVTPGVTRLSPPVGCHWCHPNRKFNHKTNHHYLESVDKS